MRILMATMGMLSIFGLGTSAHSTERPETVQVCVLKVSGMQCGACAARVDKIAKQIDGVTGAKVSQPKGTAEITYDPAKTTPHTIAKLIADKTGFATAAPTTEQN